MKRRIIGQVREYATTGAVSPQTYTHRQGQKGHLYRPPAPSPAPTPEEQQRIYKRRVAKAERDERIDVTTALTPVKTYMGGFTRPRDIRSSNWWPGGAYVLKNKVYELPDPSAYQPYTVYLLETRYPINHGVGRARAVEHVVGRCLHGSLPSVLRRYNSLGGAGSKYQKHLDDAEWPWIKTRPLKRTVWWKDDDRPEFWIKFHNGEIALDNLQEEWAKYASTTPKPQKVLAASEDDDALEEIDKPARKPTTGSPQKFSVLPSIEAVREHYLPTLESKPFFRPLLAITVSTRPIADTLARLSRAHPRGLPFYASISNDDRKYGISFGLRSRNMRLARMRSLSVEIMERLAGLKGGFIGLRFHPLDRGRGIEGEGLEDVLPLEKRRVDVAVGEWYNESAGDLELWEADSARFKGSVFIRPMDDWGYVKDESGSIMPGQDGSSDDVGEVLDGEDEDDE